MFIGFKEPFFKLPKVSYEIKHRYDKSSVYLNSDRPILDIITYITLVN